MQQIPIRDTNTVHNAAGGGFVFIGIEDEVSCGGDMAQGERVGDGRDGADSLQALEYGLLKMLEQDKMRGGGKSPRPES